MFLRDAKQSEVLLSQQDNFLSKEEVPVCTIPSVSWAAKSIQSFVALVLE